MAFVRDAGSGFSEDTAVDKRTCTFRAPSLRFLLSRIATMSSYPVRIRRVDFEHVLQPTGERDDETSIDTCLLYPSPNHESRRSAHRLVGCPSGYRNPVEIGGHRNAENETRCYQSGKMINLFGKVLQSVFFSSWMRP